MMGWDMVTQASKCRLSKFSISRPANTQAANGLYANGRHQCEVLIDVVKEISGVGDEWVRVRLTDEERASVTVVECSEHGNQTLTPGWSCDVEKINSRLGFGGINHCRWSRATTWKNVLSVHWRNLSSAIYVALRTHPSGQQYLWRV